MLPQLQEYLLANWDQLPGGGPAPKRLSFLGQGTGVSKACFFVFADSERSPRYIAKIPRSPVYNAGLIQEVSAIERLRATVSGDLQATLPGPMHTVRLADHWVVIEPVLAGQPMDSWIRPDRPLDRTTTNAHVALAHDWLVQIQREAPHRRGPLDADLIRRHFLEPLEAVRLRADLKAEEEGYVDQLAQAADSLEGAEIPLYLYHGDFRAGNILVNESHIAVLDWQFSRPLAPPLLDWFSFVFRFYSHAMALPDIDGRLETYRTAFHRVFFSHSWFSALVMDYTRAQCRALGVDEAFLSLLLGMFVVTNINKFHTFLTERAERGYLYLLRGAPTSDRSFREQLRRQAYVWLLGELAAKADGPALGSLARIARSDLRPADRGEA